MDLRRPVKRHLRHPDPPLAQLGAGALIQQRAIGDDARAVLHVVRIATGDVRELVIQHLEHGGLHVRIHDRGMLGLEAVGAIEVAAEAGDDGQRERAGAVSAGLVAAGEEGQLIELVADQHPAPDQIGQQRRGTHLFGLAIAREEALQAGQILVADMQQRAAHAVISVNDVTGCGMFSGRVQASPARMAKATAAVREGTSSVPRISET